MRFVLASQSPARLAVLRSAGLDPSVVVSGVDEDAVAAALIDPAPAELVVALAQAKAEAVVGAIASEHTDAVIVGCDSMLSIGGEMVGKPGTAEVARRRWQAMAGKSGELLTGHAVVRVEGGEVTKEASGTEVTKVHFGTPSADELEAYLASGEPLAVAGGFTLDGLGGWFVEGIEGDPSSVIGISLPLTRQLLADVGVSVADLWQPPTS
ncbi:Maf family protein [Amycolatopsis sp. NPDC059021]|uniref:Maf family protein n=1 Tax=Amycolatopsis sp. NPDC059021 TaxID=3346704 RepID=UPI00366BE4E6